MTQQRSRPSRERIAEIRRAVALHPATTPFGVIDLLAEIDAMSEDVRRLLVFVMRVAVDETIDLDQLDALIAPYYDDAAEGGSDG